MCRSSPTGLRRTLVRMLLSLTNVPRAYAWGSLTLLAELSGRTPSGGPEAEVWFGDHPGDPSDLADGRTLDVVTGGSLPYLLKLLAAKDPLSIQVHPPKAQAVAGHAREAGLAPDAPERNYRDDNHKPELLVALSDPFEALAGLRDPAHTLELLAGLGDGDGLRELRARLSHGDLADLVGWVLSGRASHVVAEVTAAVAETSVPEFAGVLAAMRIIAERNPGDPGLVVALLMNHLLLAPGEAIFLPAGTLHAYIRGLGVEIMAASDNVLRGGLTPKRVDVPELLASLDATPGPVPILRGAQAGALHAYPVPITDFALARIDVDGTEVSVPVTGPSMILSTAGSVTVRSPHSGVVLDLAPGAAAFAGADERTLVLRGPGQAFLAQPGA